MAIVAFWLFLGFFVGCLAIIWWTLYVDHDLNEESMPGEEEDDKSSNPLAGQDGVSGTFLWCVCSCPRRIAKIQMWIANIAYDSTSTRLIVISKYAPFSALCGTGGTRELRDAVMGS